jgi:hypothetical protein
MELDFILNGPLQDVEFDWKTNAKVEYNGARKEFLNDIERVSIRTLFNLSLGN